LNEIHVQAIKLSTRRLIRSRINTGEIRKCNSTEEFQTQPCIPSNSTGSESIRIQQEKTQIKAPDPAIEKEKKRLQLQANTEVKSAINSLEI
jgi:hypothetical protein